MFYLTSEKTTIAATFKFTDNRRWTGQNAVFRQKISDSVTKITFSRLFIRIPSRGAFQMRDINFVVINQKPSSSIPEMLMTIETDIQISNLPCPDVRSHCELLWLFRRHSTHAWSEVTGQNWPSECPFCIFHILGLDLCSCASMFNICPFGFLRQLDRTSASRIRILPHNRATMNPSQQEYKIRRRCKMVNLFSHYRSCLWQSFIDCIISPLSRTKNIFA
jgi:hypothetical protein